MVVHTCVGLTYIDATTTSARSLRVSRMHDHITAKDLSCARLRELTWLLESKTDGQHAGNPAVAQAIVSQPVSGQCRWQRTLTIVGTRAIRFPANLCCREYSRMLLASLNCNSSGMVGSRWYCRDVPVRCKHNERCFMGFSRI